MISEPIPPKKEQVVMCIWWEDAQFQEHEDFIGLHHIAHLTSATFVGLLKATVLCLNLILFMCRAQFYERASNRGESSTRNESHRANSTVPALLCSQFEFGRADS